MVNVGIVGLGFIGMIHYLAYQKVRGAKVRAICEKDPKRLAGDWRSIRGNFGPKGQKTDLAGVAQYPEVDELLADPRIDLIDVCLPNEWHADVTIRALKAGKHVLCEKPIATKTADAERMVRTARDCGKMLMIAHVLPFFPEYQFAYKAVTGGQYGKLKGGFFKRIISDPLWLPDFYNPDTTGGPMLDLHVHDAHFIRALCGMPERVQAIGSMRGEVAERFASQFDYGAGGPMMTATSGVIDQQGRPFTHAFEIYVERATLQFDMGVPLTVYDEKGKAKQPKLGSGDPVDAFVGELTEAARAVRTGEPSILLAGELARDALVLCRKQTQSLKQRKAVKV